MAVTQIIGPRIKPMWADPAEWTSTRAYDADTYVTYQGDSYASRQPTPIGIQITDKAYWVKISEFNAQAVAMQNSVNQTLEANETAVQDMLTQGKQEIAATKNEAEAAMNASIAQVDAKINELQSDITQIETNTNQIEANKNQIEANKNQIETNKNDIATLVTNETKYLLLFGDSFTGEGFGSGEKWYVRVAKYLNLKVLNYAVSGYSFGPEFESELAAAKNDMPEHMRRNITTCIIYGGINNILAGQQDFDTFSYNVRSFVEDVISWLPNAKIYVMAPNSGSMLLERQTIAVSKTACDSYVVLKNALQKLGVVYVFPYYWLYGGDYFVDDMLHPNAIGNNIIADQMIESICGTRNLNSNLLFYNRNTDNPYIFEPQEISNAFLGNAAYATIDETVHDDTQHYSNLEVVFSNGRYYVQASNVRNFKPQNSGSYAELELTFHTNANLQIGRFYSYMYDTSYYMTASMSDNKLSFKVYHTGGTVESGLNIAYFEAVIVLGNPSYNLF